MNLSKLSECLKPWMQVETWHTNHPSDEKRFNKSINHAFSELGENIHSSDFEEVISELAELTSPDMKESYREKLVTKYVIRAENIVSYLLDTK